MLEHGPTGCDFGDARGRTNPSAVDQSWHSGTSVGGTRQGDLVGQPGEGESGDRPAVEDPTGARLEMAPAIRQTTLGRPVGRGPEGSSGYLRSGYREAGADAVRPTASGGL